MKKIFVLFATLLAFTVYSPQSYADTPKDNKSDTKDDNKSDTKDDKSDKPRNVDTTRGNVVPKIKIDPRLAAKIDKVFSGLLIETNKNLEALTKTGKAKEDTVESLIAAAKKRVETRSKFLHTQLERSLKLHKNRFLPQKEQVQLGAWNTPKDTQSRADHMVVLGVDFGMQFRNVQFTGTTQVNRETNEKMINKLEKHAERLREYINLERKRAITGLNLSLRNALEVIKRRQQKKDEE